MLANVLTNLTILTFALKGVNLLCTALFFSLHFMASEYNFTVKPVLRGHSKRRPKIVFQDRSSLNTGQKYCRMLQESILQYFRPALSYHRLVDLCFVYF